MILCSLTDADLYAAIHPRIAQGIAYLRSAAWQGLPDSVVELEKDGLYAHIQHYQTIPLAEAQWEAHRIYTDIQWLTFTIGGERM